jgi:RNA polymerase sigma factor (sigma-70 family)
MTVFENDPELLRQFQRGDKQALSRVYWHYIERIEAVVRRSLSVAGYRHRMQHQLEIADLVQEAFVRAFAERARNAYDPVRQYGPYLVTIARNCVVDSLRHDGIEEHVDPQTVGDTFEEWPHEEPSEPWSDPETMALVEHFVRSLPAAEHDVFIERYEKGRSQIETAIQLRLSRQQVRTLEAHVRDGLARALSRAKLRISVGEPALPIPYVASAISIGGTSLGTSNGPKQP